MIKIADQPMTGAPVSGWASPYSTSYKWLSEPALVGAPTTFGRLTYATGRPGGTSAGITQSTKFAALGYREVYVRYSVRVSSNWYGHPSGTNKTMHLWVTNPTKNKIFMSLEGMGAGALNLQVRGQSTANDALYGHLRANQGNSALITRGVWHTVELYVKLNSTGVADGIVKAWLNGNLTQDYRTVQIDGSAWQFAQLSPTWGGTGGTVPATMTMDVDQIYVSGR